MSGATLHALASDEGSGVTIPLTPDVVLQVTPARSAPPLLRKSAAKPLQKGMELEVALKSDGLPKKSQRSVFSTVPAKASVVSMMFHGCEPARVTMVLSFQPSSIWPKPFFPGMS